MNYAYNEAKMLEGIRAYRHEVGSMPRRKYKTKKRTSCKRGHPLNSKNAYLHPSRGYIVCKACTARHGRHYYQRNKEVLREKKRIYYYTKRAEGSTK